MSYPWLDESIKRWHEIISNKEVPHAILLSGIKGLGKLNMATNMAHYALCENLTELGVCQACNACHLLKANNHTDLSLIQAEKNVIKVEQIRQLTKNITLTSSRNQYKVVIIDNAEQMNNAAANSLLKTLEEPPKKVIIILTTSEVGKLLPTIKSRCIKINLSIPEHQLSFQWLKTNTNKTDDEIALSLLLANNAPILAFEILSAETLLSIKQMLSDLYAISSQQKTALEISKSWIKNEWHKNLEFLAAYLLYLNKKDLGLVLENKHLPKDLPVIKLASLPFINELHKFISLQKTPLKLELLIEHMLIFWKKGR